jgi:hypothetical protein
MSNADLTDLARRIAEARKRPALMAAWSNRTRRG